MLPNKTIADIVLKKKLLSKDKVQELVKETDLEGGSLEDYVVAKSIIPEEKLYRTIAETYDTPFIDLSKHIVRKDILFLIPEPIAQSHNLVAFDKENGQVKVATTDPQDLEIMNILEKKLGSPLAIHVTTPSSIKEVLHQYRKGLSQEFKAITHEAPQDGLAAPQEASPEELKALAHDIPVVRVVDTLLDYAIFERASDIHIEPTEKNVVVRYRIDGVLRDVMTLPKNTHSGIIARIKILSNLKIDEHRIPQDGRFKVATPEYKVAFRVSTFPMFDGEKIVLRLLPESAKIASLEELGLEEDALKVVKRALEKPHGTILVTGPTGSGKTTTLYTMLARLNVPGVNISTIEDPIEYRMPRVNQSQVNPRIGFTFAIGLRSLVRQDPNVIMVGEIRDAETAEIAIHAAMTGHLVLATLHTNDAVTAIPRLLDMGIPAFLVASTITVIIAQRLVRIICPDCKESYTLSSAAFSDLEAKVNMKLILPLIETETALSPVKTDAKTGRGSSPLVFYRGKGCKTCSHEGYRGRIGVYEVFEMTKEMAELVLERAAAERLREQAARQGMHTMLQDGFVKAAKGITTFEEVLRVTQE